MFMKILTIVALVALAAPPWDRVTAKPALRHSLRSGNGSRGAEPRLLGAFGSQRHRKLEPITYKGLITTTLTNGANDCTSAVCTYCSGNEGLWDWYKAVLVAGTTYSFEVNRIDCGLDPISLLYSGVSDESDDLVQVAGSDDARCSIHCPSCWPYEDPLFSYTPAVTDVYSLMVASFLSGACPADGNFDYQIIINPPPSTLFRTDVQPGDGVGCLNINDKGKMPVAILGDTDSHVADIDPPSLVLDVGGGVLFPVSIKPNGKIHCATEDANGDGHDDLVCHFQDDTTSWTPLEDEVTAVVRGNLMDGSTMAAMPDPVCIAKQPPFCRIESPVQTLSGTGGIIDVTIPNLPLAPDGTDVVIATYARGDLGDHPWEVYAVYGEDLSFLGVNDGGPYYDCDPKFGEADFTVLAATYNSWVDDDGGVTIRMDASYHVNTFCSYNEVFVAIIVLGMDCP